MWFIEEYTKLQKQTPRLGLLSVNSENSAYTNYSSFNKNCYYTFGVHYCEDCYYLGYSNKNTDCVDCEDIESSELLYECFMAEKCYNCAYSAYIFTCSDCGFCWDLVNCQNCFLCTGLQNKSYCIENEKCTKEEYVEKRKQLLAQHSPAELWQKLENLRQKFPQRAIYQKNCENCIGHDLRYCKNVFYSFAAKNCEDCIYTLRHMKNVKDGVDIECVAADPTEEIYNSIGVSGGKNIFCSWIVWFSGDIFYCEQIYNSHNCLGCIGRNHAEFEILNKKYPKEEYFKKFREIEGELREAKLWGKMWLPATYPYEDTLAALYYSG